jgi:hypothetical protein
MAEAQQIMAVNVGLRALCCLFACSRPYWLAFGKTRAQHQQKHRVFLARYRRWGKWPLPVREKTGGLMDFHAGSAPANRSASAAMD